MKMKKYLTFFIIGTVILSSFVCFLARAEEEEESEDEETDRQTQSTVQTKSSASSSNSGKTKTTVETDVKTVTKTTVIKDSDGDGILDEEDSHPDIAEIYIVEDKNLNGIVDSFEVSAIE